MCQCTLTWPANDLPKQLKKTCLRQIFSCWLISPMLVWCDGEFIVPIIHINNGTKEPTMGIDIAIPITYWYPVGMSRWENLCILEVLCRSIPLWRNFSTMNVNCTSSKHWHYFMRNHCCLYIAPWIIDLPLKPSGGQPSQPLEMTNFAIFPLTL